MQQLEKMNDIHHIAIKECRESLRNGSLKLFSLLMVFFLICAISIGFINYRHLVVEKKVASADVRQQWLNQGVKNPHGAGHFGMVTFKPIEPLNSLEKGMNNYFGQWIYLETHNRNDAEKKPVKDLSSLTRFGEFTAAFLVQFIAPLFIILLCYSSVSSEKENNTLRLVLSQQLSMNVFIIGKCLGNIYKLVLIFLPVFVLTLVGIVISTGGDTDALLVHIFMCMSYLLYLLAFLFISIGVSALSNSSKQALIVLFSFWIISCVFVPRFISSLSESIHPTPSSFDLKTTYEQSQGNKYVYGYKGLSSFKATYTQVEQRLMKEYNVSNPDSLPVDVFGFAIEETEEEGQRLFEKMYGELNIKFLGQDKVHRVASIISPLAAIRFLSMGLSHSDIEEQIHFSEQSERYRRMIMKTLNMDLAYHSKIKKYTIRKGDGTEKYARSTDLWQTIPDFNYTPLSLSQVLKNHRSDLAILTIWLLVSILFTIQTAKKLVVS